MTILEIENNLKNLVNNFNKESFIFDLLLAYGSQKATIKRLQGSDHDKLEEKGELVLRKKLFFKVPDNDIHVAIDELKSDPGTLKHNPRFIVVTDFETILAYDTKTDDYLDIPLFEITNHSNFFLPWAGMEKNQIENENPADVKAAEKMGKLYDEISKNNHFETNEEIHSLNVFLTRLLFCYFAEDTGIFEDNSFTKAIASYTQTDGSDLDIFLDRMFDIFNTKDRDGDTPKYLKDFPYVNGGLFKNKFPIPKFTARSRNAMIEVGELGWSEINPDIFGSMIQAVVSTEHRGTMGMHYTSVPNIMKVIEPLFLDELYEEFERGFESKIILQKLLTRISNIKLFDPACGSGNFLIIGYKKLRELEMAIIKRIEAITKQKTFNFSEIKLTNFYGIELDDFAHEVAILSLWLAEHQMNIKFYEEFGRTPPSLPLNAGGNVVQGNATRLHWEEVCPKNDGDEIYILGNPPYLGSRNQNKNQKEDMKIVFEKDYKSLDYIAAWFYKGASYIRNFNAKCAFVSTNSVSQGEQVSLIWKRVLQKDLEIYFAHQSFKWSNNAKSNANVIVVIIGISNQLNTKKYIFKNNFRQEVQNINPYLTSGNTIFITRSSKSISQFPEMKYGNMPNDKGNLILSTEEKVNLEKNYKESSKYIKKFIGASDYIRGNERYCLWISDEDLDDAIKIPEIKKRINGVIAHRNNSSEKSTREKASTPNQFYFTSHEKTNSILIPRHSSERRIYIPIGLFDDETIIADSAMAIYHAEVWLLGVITSLMHMIWMKAVGGKIKTDYRYSTAIVYNTFPFPEISQSKKEEIEELVFNILDERENYPEKTLAQLYDPDKMPESLKEAHHQLDLAIEKCYKSTPFRNDEERLEHLFKLYEEMTKGK